MERWFLWLGKHYFSSVSILWRHIVVFIWSLAPKMVTSNSAKHQNCGARIPFTWPMCRVASLANKVWSWHWFYRAGWLVEVCIGINFWSLIRKELHLALGKQNWCSSILSCVIQCMVASVSWSYSIVCWRCKFVAGRLSIEKKRAHCYGNVKYLVAARKWMERLVATRKWMEPLYLCVELGITLSSILWHQKSAIIKLSTSASSKI